MTLPTETILPLPQDYKNDQNPDLYLNDLIFDLQNMYEQIAQGVNGTIRSYADVDSSEWIPTISGSTLAGSTTYTHQIGWVWRQGIMTEVWGDIMWSSTTATGNLLVDLPYLVTKSAQIPFVGTVQTSSFTYTSGTNCSINAIPSTYTAAIWNYGTGIATSPQAIVSSGRIIFHLRYIGISDE